MTAATETVTRERIEHAFGLVGKIVTAKVEAVAELRALWESWEAQDHDTSSPMWESWLAAVESLHEFADYMDKDGNGSSFNFESMLSRAEGVKALLLFAGGLCVRVGFLSKPGRGGRAPVGTDRSSPQRRSPSKT